MDPQQEKYWAVLEFVDEYGTKLERDEIDFVAGLIDNDRRGKLTPGDCVEIRRLLTKRAGGWRAFNRHQESIVVERHAES